MLKGEKFDAFTLAILFDNVYSVMFYFFKKVWIDTFVYSYYID